MLVGEVALAEFVEGFGCLFYQFPIGFHLLDRGIDYGIKDASNESSHEFREVDLLEEVLVTRRDRSDGSGEAISAKTFRLRQILADADHAGGHLALRLGRELLVCRAQSQ